MRESALTFGPADLVGVLTEPDPERAIPGAPGHIILNSGILHRPGASRIYVKIARALAEDGYHSLRFDFSGIGDSAVRKDAIPIEERFVVETGEAMDYLEDAIGTDRFVLGGLCSGGDAGFFAAKRDDRVVGLWQIDAFCYPTIGYYTRRFGPKLLSPSAWINAVRARIPRPSQDDEDKDQEVFVKPEYRRIFPPKPEVEEGLGALLERGVRLYFFFTGGLDEYNYARQHEEAFPKLRLGERSGIRYIADCSHTVTGLEHQVVLVSDIRDWMKAFEPTVGVSV